MPKSRLHDGRQLLLRCTVTQPCCTNILARREQRSSAALINKLEPRVRVPNNLLAISFDVHEPAQGGPLLPLRLRDTSEVQPPSRELTRTTMEECVTHCACNPVDNSGMLLRVDTAPDLRARKACRNIVAVMMKSVKTIKCHEHRLNVATSSAVAYNHVSAQP
jgi:hypothetical protein